MPAPTMMIGGLDAGEEEALVAIFGGSRYDWLIGEWELIGMGGWEKGIGGKIRDGGSEGGFFDTGYVGEDLTIGRVVGKFTYDLVVYSEGLAGSQSLIGVI